MPKWDVDKFLADLGAPDGTTFTRTLVSVAYLVEVYKLKPTQAQKDSGSVVVWCLSIGRMTGYKHFVYGLTIRGCCLRARKEIKTWTPHYAHIYGVTVKAKKKMVRKLPRKA
jgi:hypothetical protein